MTYPLRVEASAKVLKYRCIAPRGKKISNFNVSLGRLIIGGAKHDVGE
jgi:hypothetical protein